MVYSVTVQYSVVFGMQGITLMCHGVVFRVAKMLVQ